MNEKKIINTKNDVMRNEERNIKKNGVKVKWKRKYIYVKYSP